MIKIQNLKKTYKDCVALDTVSMHIRKGEFVAIIEQAEVENYHTEYYWRFRYGLYGKLCSSK